MIPLEIFHIKHVKWICFCQFGLSASTKVNGGWYVSLCILGWYAARYKKYKIYFIIWGEKCQQNYDFVCKYLISKHTHTVAVFVQSALILLYSRYCCIFERNEEKKRMMRGKTFVWSDCTIENIELGLVASSNSVICFTSTTLSWFSVKELCRPIKIKWTNESVNSLWWHINMYLFMFKVKLVS